MAVSIKRLLNVKVATFAVVFIAALFVAGDTIGKAVAAHRMEQLLLSEKEMYNELQETLSEYQKKSHSLSQFLDSVDRSENRIRLKYGLSPIDFEERKLGIGGLPSVEVLAKRELSNFEVKQSLELKQLAQHHLRKISYTDSVLQRVKSQVEKEITYQNELPSIWPVVGRVTSPYGFRPHPILAMRKFHDGIDIKGKMWTPIVAPADGVVAFAGWRKGYGKMVEISHRGSNLYTRYGHLADMSVKVGDVVKRGDKIAFLGNSGRSTGPHVHYEVRKENRGGGTRNPRLYLPDTTVIFD